MKRAELLRRHKQLSAKALSLMKVKNQDYGANEDPFRNFRRHGLYGITVRLSDKLARLDNFIERGKFSVKDESLIDSCLDIINYAVLFAAMNEDLSCRKN